MSELKIKDGAGSGNVAKVDGRNQLKTRSISETDQQAAVSLGNAFNLNTGTLALSSSGESAIMYLKNNEDVDFVLTSLAVGIGTVASPDDSAYITLVRNPTSGTVVSDASNVGMNQNRNFASNKTLTADVYKGGEGKTLTGGSDIAIFYGTGGSRMFASIDLDLPKGTAVGLKVDVNSATGGNVYGAFIGHLKDAVE